MASTTFHKTMVAMMFPIIGCGGIAVPQTATPIVSTDTTPTPIPTPSPTDTGTPDPTPTLTWQSKMETEFANHCLACHPGLDPAFDSASQASVKAFYSTILARVNNGTMPPGGLDPATLADFRAWGTAGNP